MIGFVANGTEGQPLPGGARNPTFLSGGSFGGPSPLSTVRAITLAPTGAAGVLDWVMTPRQFAALEPPLPFVVPVNLTALMHVIVPLKFTGPIGVDGNSVENVPETPSWPFGAVEPSAVMLAEKVPSGVGSGSVAAPHM